MLPVIARVCLVPDRIILDWQQPHLPRFTSTWHFSLCNSDWTHASTTLTYKCQAAMAKGVPNPAQKKAAILMAKKGELVTSVGMVYEIKKTTPLNTLSHRILV